MHGCLAASVRHLVWQVYTRWQALDRRTESSMLWLSGSCGTHLAQTKRRRDEFEVDDSLTADLINGPMPNQPFVGHKFKQSLPPKITFEDLQRLREADTDSSEEQPHPMALADDDDDASKSAVRRKSAAPQRWGKSALLKQ